MTDTPTPGETVVTDDSKTAVTPPVTPPVVKTEDTGETERLRKELEQAKMRENQLANQLKSKEEADAKAEEEKLKENEQYKELFEQEKTKREALETEQETKEREAELTKVTAETLSGFSDDVKSLAEEVGLSLTDTDEASVSKFKEKLEKLSAKVGSETKVTPNNPNQPESKTELDTEKLREVLHDDKDGNAFHDIVMDKFPGIAAMTAPPKVAK